MSDTGATEPYLLTVDGQQRTVQSAASTAHLQQVLADVLGYQAVKNGCEQGRCGACAVLLDGTLVTACTTLALAVAGRSVTTARQLAAEPETADIADALVSAGAIQCGYCTPGFTVAIANLLAQNPEPDEEQVRAGLAGNLCRCTGYVRIVEAVAAVVARRRGSR